MHVGAREAATFPAGRPFVKTTVFFLRTQEGVDGPGLIVATGSDLMRVETATGTDFDAAGRRALTWVPLEPEAAVFARESSDAELDAMVVRAATTDGRWFQVGGRGSSSGEPHLQPGLLAVSPPGADPEVLTCASTAFSAWPGGAPPGSEAVLGATPRLGDQWIGLAVARAPAGGYLVGLCRTTRPGDAERSSAQQSEGFVVPAPAGGADDLLVLVPCERSPGLVDVAAVCVIAPKGVAEVEVGGVRAPVRDRVAVVRFPAPTPVDGLRATARGTDGDVLGPVKRADGEEAVSQSALRDYPSQMSPRPGG
jgi:hypothetical protein